MKNLVVCICLAHAAAGARGAAVHTGELVYEHAGARCSGYIAWPEDAAGPRPGVLVVHEWWGLNDFARQQARRLAELGYVALAADMYGDGKATADPQEAARLAGELRADAALWRGRAQAAYEALRRHEKVDSQRLAAIGFCFGGSTVIELACAGVELDGVVSFHGGLGAPAAPPAGAVKARVLALHGAADTLVPPEKVAAFEQALTQAGADWQLVVYSGARHSFTNPDADRMQAPGIGYDRNAAERSWRQMKLFLAELWAPGAAVP